MRNVLLLTICAPIFLQAQVTRLGSCNTTGTVSHKRKAEVSATRWVANLNWEQVKEKAKKENRYIFIDCFTTWCRPCKRMDKEVYSNDTVSALLNDKFVSVKVQMDSTKGDNAFTQSWYRTAKEMSAAYRVAAYPTFLFFSPDGKIAYKDVGYKLPHIFIQTLPRALDPATQYHTLLKQYHRGQKDFARMPYLITLSKQVGDTVNYFPLVADYYSYLRSHGHAKLLTRENIAFGCRREA